MSQNDIIYLDLKNFTVWHSDVENASGKVKKYKSLKKALIEAEKLQDKWSPEYGIFISQSFSKK